MYYNAFSMTTKPTVTVFDKEFTPKDNWPIKDRIHNKAPAPIGYKVSDTDELKFEPHWEQIVYLEEALDFVDNGKSFREVADWLNTVLPRSVSHQGFINVWRRVRGVQPDNARAKEIRKKKRENAPKTSKEKKEHALKLKIAGARRSETMQKRKLEAIQGPKEEPTPITYEEYVEKIEKAPEADPFEGREVLFAPNPGPQTTFLAASEQEVLYGGAAGGGKSYALLADPLRYFDNPNFRGLIFRRTNDELRELKQKAQMLYLRAYPKAKWNQKESEFVFPSGARLWFTYLERDDDVMRYQGQSFSYIAFDELTQYPTPTAWDYMRSRLRTTDPTLPTFMRATTNPGGPGHGWVKKMFIDPAPHGQTFDARSIETNEVLLHPPKRMDGSPHPKAGQPLFQRRFIPARLSDNKYLFEDGQYEANLQSMSEMRRRQLLEGDWNVADGAAFPEFNAHVHTINPFAIPSGWKRFRSCDYGYNSFSAVHWYAINPINDQIVVYRELYVTKHTGAELAHRILELEQDEVIQYGMLDSSVWHQRGQTGPSIAEEMIMMGCRWRPADRSKGSRANGKNRLHELLRLTGYGEEEIPGVVFFNTCRQIITDLPVIPASPDGSDDIDDRYASDHAYDSIRYGIMSRPKAFNPFDFHEKESTYVPADRTLGY